MSFSLSAQFPERWIESPDALKKAIYDDLDDLVLLLDEQTRLDTFVFQTPDLNQTLHALQTAHLQTLHTLAQKRHKECISQIQPKLEQELESKLREKLSEKMLSLDHELRQWLKQAIIETLAKELPPPDRPF